MSIWIKLLIYPVAWLNKVLGPLNEWTVQCRLHSNMQKFGHPFSKNNKPEAWAHLEDQYLISANFDPLDRKRVIITFHSLFQPGYFGFKVICKSAPGAPIDVIEEKEFEGNFKARYLRALSFELTNENMVIDQILIDKDARPLDAQRYFERYLQCREDDKKSAARWLENALWDGHRYVRKGEGWIELGLLYMDCGKPYEALSSYERARTKAGESLDHVLDPLCISALAQNEKLEESVALLQVAVKSELFEKESRDFFDLDQVWIERIQHMSPLWRAKECNLYDKLRQKMPEGNNFWTMIEETEK